MGRVQLRRLQEFKKARKRNAGILKKMFSGSEKILLPTQDARSDACWYTFPITLKSGSRKKVLDALDHANIEWRPILAGNVARQPAFKNEVIVRDKLNNADQLIHQSFWVSVHPTHSIEVMEFVGNTIKKALD